MGNNNGNLALGLITGFGIFAVGALFEPLLMILGGLIIISGTVTKVV